VVVGRPRGRQPGGIRRRARRFGARSAECTDRARPPATRAHTVTPVSSRAGRVSILYDAAAPAIDAPTMPAMPAIRTTTLTPSGIQVHGVAPLESRYPATHDGLRELRAGSTLMTVRGQRLMKRTTILPATRRAVPF